MSYNDPFEWKKPRKFRFFERVRKEQTKKGVYPYNYIPLKGTYECPLDFLGHLGMFSDWIYYNFQRPSRFKVFTFRKKENSYGKMQTILYQFGEIEFDVDILGNRRSNWIIKPDIRRHKFWRDAKKKREEEAIKNT